MMYNAYVVDDERWALLGICNTFHWDKHGFALSGSTTDPARALSDIIESPPDVVFTDVRMPGISGIDLMRRARESGVLSEFVIISGYGEFNYAREAIQYQVFDYCLKPVLESSAEELLSRLAAKLDGLRVAWNDMHGFERLLADIAENFHRPIQLRDLAAKHFLSPNYVSALFRSRLDTSFSAYLSEIRMRQGCYLLAETTLSVAEVAQRCGYQDARYFARVFQKQHRMTPLQYRRAQHA